MTRFITAVDAAVFFSSSNIVQNIYTCFALTKLYYFPFSKTVRDYDILPTKTVRSLFCVTTLRTENHFEIYVTIGYQKLQTLWEIK